MNLLYDPWIPVRVDGVFRHATLKEILCVDGDYNLFFHRDDMELAALQLMVCLTQVVFTPKDDKELRQKESSPMSEAEYNAGVESFKEIFVLDHPEHPFMQKRGVKADVITPVQKLFVGLPEGNNHSLFNGPGEISRICPSCIAIALFNQASNCPSFGGGFKGSLRGAAPITTLVEGDTLRTTIWRNVISRTRFKRTIPYESNEDKPVWMTPLRRNENVYSHNIGILRGLFWQPARIEVEWLNRKGCCDACGANGEQFTLGFKKEKFKYEIKGVWPHPYSPYGWDLKKDERAQRFASFTTTAPAWTQLTEFLMKKESEKEGNVPAAVVSQFGEVFIGERLRLVVGGYQVKQALVLQRRHDLISLPSGWSENMNSVEDMVNNALGVKAALRGKIYWFGKEIGAPGLAAQAEGIFYRDSEPTVHETFRNMNWHETIKVKADFADRLARLAKRIFDEVTEPYSNNPENLKKLAASRRALNSALNKITGKGGKVK